MSGEIAAANPDMHVTCMYVSNLPPQKHLNRDQERAAMLKCQAEWDSTHQRLEGENTELKRRVEGLANENGEIKKAFKKLLQ